MKQIGNLAAVCAKRPDVLMQVYEGMISVYVCHGPERTYMLAAWDDEAKIRQIIYELNFGRYVTKQKTIVCAV
ncbi:MAG: hypothetical protein IKM11_05745 [Oscillospiraceae bacterium]|nr:hypothetical protein [Oscillospiraceae bacterium]